MSKLQPIELLLVKIEIMRMELLQCVTLNSKHIAIGIIGVAKMLSLVHRSRQFGKPWYIE
jgi:hypothetical protein